MWSLTLPSPRKLLTYTLALSIPLLTYIYINHHIHSTLAKNSKKKKEAQEYISRYNANRADTVYTINALLPDLQQWQDKIGEEIRAKTRELQERKKREEWREGEVEEWKAWKWNTWKEIKLLSKVS